MVDRSVETQGAITVAQAKRMYQRTLSLWVMDYLTSRSLLREQRATRPATQAHATGVAHD